MNKTKNIPQAVIEKLEPREGFSYIKYLGTQDGISYYCLFYYVTEDVGFPKVVACENDVIVMVYEGFESLEIISLFIK